MLEMRISEGSHHLGGVGGSKDDFKGICLGGRKRIVPWWREEDQGPDVKGEEHEAEAEGPKERTKIV